MSQQNDQHDPDPAAQVADGNGQDQHEQQHKQRHEQQPEQGSDRTFVPGPGGGRMVETAKLTEADRAVMAAWVRGGKRGFTDQIIRVTASALRTGVYQPMPALADDEYQALSASIAHDGVLAPLDVICVREDDADVLVVVEGNNRAMIAQARNLDVPVRVLGISPDEAMDYALQANANRRQLSTEQKDALISSVLLADHAAGRTRSNREVARLTGTSHNTVSRVRDRLAETGQVDQFRKSAGGRPRNDGTPARHTERKPPTTAAASETVHGGQFPNQDHSADGPSQRDRMTELNGKARPLQPDSGPQAETQGQHQAEHAFGDGQVTEGVEQKVPLDDLIPEDAKEVASLQAEVTRLEAEMEKLREANAELREKLKSEQAEAANARRERDDRQRDLSAAQQNLKRLEAGRAKPAGPGYGDGAGMVSRKAAEQIIMQAVSEAKVTDQEVLWDLRLKVAAGFDRLSTARASR